MIAVNSGLQERELLKQAELTSTLAEALRQRGITDPSATLIAETGIAVLKVASVRESCDSFSESHLTSSKPSSVLGDEKTEKQREAAKPLSRLVPRPTNRLTRGIVKRANEREALG